MDYSAPPVVVAEDKRAISAPHVRRAEVKRTFLVCFPASSNSISRRWAHTWR